jgi:3-hydroxybutyryl-CoA dehydratase
MSLDHGYYLEDLSPGMEASVSKTVTDDDITAFAELSGDINPVHLNEEFAAGTVFKKRIAHELIATCKVTAVDMEKGRVSFDCVCEANGRPVLTGEALLMVSRRPTGD